MVNNLLPDRTFLSNSIAPINKKTRSHISLKFDRPINKKPDRPSTKNPAVETAATQTKPDESGLKISPDDFQSPNTLFVRVGGHRLCRRGFQPPEFQPPRISN
ncbi:hypothetical protein [Microcoleus sp. K5-D4]|uniref:hypothetical protein n=1 Tax=Microcoleus sp. K5-D4 TaxID=2818801 RepID=UPI002FD509A3